jgi:hypothetical protein
MSERPGENGYPRARPRLPTGVVVASIVVALVAVSGLIAVLYRETRGPGEVLRRFAEALDAGDCDGAFGLLHESVAAEVEQAAWCGESLRTLDTQLDADFRMERAVLEGDVARVEVSGVPTTEWLLRRHGERSWRVVGPAPTELPR